MPAALDHGKALNLRKAWDDEARRCTMKRVDREILEICESGARWSRESRRPVDCGRIWKIIKPQAKGNRHIATARMPSFPAPFQGAIDETSRPMIY